MVAPANFRVNFGAGNIFSQFRGDEKIVDAPADIPLARAGALAPPRIFHLVGMQFAEGVEPIFRDQFVEPLSFHWQKSGNFFVRFRAGEVDVAVRGIHIAAKNDGFRSPQFFRESQKCFVKFEFVFQPLVARFPIWKINIQKIKLRKFGEQNPTLAVQNFCRKFARDFNRLDFRKNGDAGIAGTLGGIPKSFPIFGRQNIFVELIWSRFCFLNCDEVGVGFFQKFQKSFFRGGANAIHVPRDEFNFFHEKILTSKVEKRRKYLLQSIDYQILPVLLFPK